MKFLGLLPLAYLVVAFLGQDVGPARSHATALTEGWRFIPNALVGEDVSAFAGVAVEDGLHPGTPWGKHPRLAATTGGTFLVDWHAPDTVQTYGLRVPAFYGAYRIYFDGRLAGGRGEPTLDYQQHADFVASEVIALPRRPRVAITFEAATHDVYPGGAATAFTVDNYALLQSTEDRVVALTLFVIGLLTAIGFTVAAAAWGSPVSRRQRAFGALVIAVAGFVAFNDTALLASQWLVVPYAGTYRVKGVFLYGSMALAWIYAATAGGVTAFPRVRTTLVYAMLAATAITLLLPMAWSSRILPLAYAPMAFGCLFVGYRAIVAEGWRDESIALARISLFALAAGVIAASITEIGVDQARGLLTLLCFLTFGVVGAAQFIRQLVAEQGELLAEARASDSKTQFMARVSHELRTPLHGIVGLSKIIREGALSQNQLRYLEALDVSATAMEVTVAGLLDYEDVRTGKLVLTERTVDLPELFAEALSTGSIQLAAGATIGLRDHSGVQSFKVDGKRLRDALVQLLENAVKYGEGQHPMVHATRVGQELEILVRSGGTTLSPEQVATAFTPFSQREEYWQRKQGGLGIGLSMAAAVVERMGGGIRHVPLEQGNGFILTVPLEEVTEVAANEVNAFEVLRETSAPEALPRRSASVTLPPRHSPNHPRSRTPSAQRVKGRPRARTSAS